MIVDIAKSIKSGKYKHLSLYAEALERRIYDYADIIYDHLNLPDHVYIKLRPIPHALGYARYMQDSNLTVCEVQLDIRQRLTQFDSTLIHELIHAEQYKAGDLVYSESLKCLTWRGKPYSLKHFTYYELPWELDAYSRSEKLTQLIFGNY